MVSAPVWYCRAANRVQAAARRLAVPCTQQCQGGHHGTNQERGDSHGHAGGHPTVRTLVTAVAAFRVAQPCGGPHGTSSPASKPISLLPPSRPDLILYDQYNNPGTNSTSSQDFEAAKTRQGAGLLLAIVGGVTAVVFGGIGAVFATRPVKERVTANVETYVSPTGGGLVGSF